MSKRRVLELAWDIRLVLERLAKRIHDDVDLTGYCGRASAQLLVATQAEDIVGVEAHMNCDHAFNVYTYRRRRYLIDITATQFGVKERIFVRDLQRGGRPRNYHISERSTVVPDEVDFLHAPVEVDRRHIVRFQQRRT